MSLVLLFHYLMLNMSRLLIQPSSGACDLHVELFHGLYCSGSMCVGVTLWFGCGGVVSVCRLKHQCFIISLFNAQHVSDVNTSILRTWRLICWVISWVVLLWFDVCWCYVVVWLWWCGIRMQAEALSFFYIFQFLSNCVYQCQGLIFVIYNTSIFLLSVPLFQFISMIYYRHYSDVFLNFKYAGYTLSFLAAC